MMNRMAKLMITSLLSLFAGLALVVGFSFHSEAGAILIILGFSNSFMVAGFIITWYENPEADKPKLT